MRTSPITAVPTPSVKLPEPAGPPEVEVVRLRRMVHAMAEILVEHGMVDASVLEGRLRLAVEAPTGLEEAFVIKKPGFFARLFGRKPKRELDGVVPTAIMPDSDQTLPVEKLPFEVQSLYDEPLAGSQTRKETHKSSSAPKTGTCNRCWRIAPLSTGQLCARCAVKQG